MLITVSVVMMLQIWHLGFSHFLLPVDVTVCGKFDPTRMFLKFEGCLYAQNGVTSNGCLEDVNSLIIDLLARFDGWVVSVNNRKTAI